MENLMRSVLLCMVSYIYAIWVYIDGNSDCRIRVENHHSQVHFYICQTCTVYLSKNNKIPLRNPAYQLFHVLYSSSEISTNISLSFVKFLLLDKIFKCA